MLTDDSTLSFSVMWMVLPLCVTPMLDWDGVKYPWNTSWMGGIKPGVGSTVLVSCE